MPQRIEHIDAIARKTQSDALFIQFADPAGAGGNADGSISYRDWMESAARHAVIAWLEDKQIIWRPCGAVADTHSMHSYSGQIYIDVPFDEADAAYQKVVDYLENQDGSSRLPGVKFFVLEHAVAMKNAHHDDPGFWERWAENF